MGSIWAIVISVILFAASTLVGLVTRPTTVRCPKGYYVNGVPPSGHTTCEQAPPLGWPDDKPWTGISYPVRIYCTGGALPIVHNARVIGCQR